MARDDDPARLADGAGWRPRVLAYTDNDGVGGAEVSLAQLLEALRSRAEVTAVVADRSVGAFLEERCPGVAVQTIPRVDGKTDVRGFLAHVRLLREARPDVLHVNLPHPWSGQYAIMASAFVPRTRVVAVEHSPRPTTSTAQRRLRTLVQSHIDAQVTVGAASARELEQLLGRPAGSVRVIPNGVVDVPLPEVARDGAPPRIGFVGRLAHEKGPDVLVRALADLPGVEAVLVGDGPEKDAVLALAAELGVAERLTLAGWHDHPRALLPTFDLLVMPSRRESFGLVAVEAMLARLPVVAARVGSVPEVVADGETGVLVAPDDPPALAAAVRALLADPEAAAALGDRGRERALARFSRERMAEDFLALYAELVGVRR